MTLAGYAELLYRYATGWLGWTDAAAMRASIHRIELALDGKVDFLKKTNPWGSGEDAVKPVASKPLPKERVASGIAGLLRGMQKRRGS